MGEIMITMPRYEDANRIGDIIRRSDIWQEPIICTTGADTLQKVQSRDIQVVICSKKFKDMGYEELTSYLPLGVSVILLTQDSQLLPFSSSVVKLLMPFKPMDLVGTIKLLMPELAGKPKAKKLKRSPEEQKTIDDAKKVLMDRNEMSEPDAYRYIQKNSMDTGRTIVESAQMILMMYDEK